MKTDTETPLNARLLATALAVRQQLAEADVEAYDSMSEEALMVEMGRAVLAEAERALRERAAKLKADARITNGRSLDCETGEVGTMSPYYDNRRLFAAKEVGEAADLLAGMRG